MVTREVIQVVEGMLGQTEEVLRLLLLQIFGLDGYAEREDGTASLMGVAQEDNVSTQCQLHVGFRITVSENKRTGEQTLPSAQSSMSSSGSFAR